MTITLYHAPGSRSARVLWLLLELGIEFDLVSSSLAETIETGSVRKIHPLGRIPVLVEDGRTIFESVAIIQHLCENYQHCGLWREPGHRERTQLLEWLSFSETMITHIQNLNQQFDVIRPEAARSEVVVKLETRRLEKTLAFFDDALGGRVSILDDFSAADIAMGVSVLGARRYANVSALSAVSRYCNALLSRPVVASNLKRLFG